MVDRIRALLLAWQLSPTQFADAIGVARPIMSHILSGRNKPSLEVVQKVLAAFPELSMPWLLSGTGPMLAPAAPTASEPNPETAPKAAPPAPRVPAPRRAVAPALVAAAPALGPLAPTSPIPEAGPAAVPAVAFTSPAPIPEATSLASPAEVAITPASAAASPPAAAAPVGNIPPELALFAEPGKAIRRIVIFYRDGTFADYQPE
ncbi:MAG: helix-turn-helix domain-containing protein [Janthinobacterium lividum]